MNFTCSECNKDFPADPDCVLESFIGVECEMDPADSWKQQPAPRRVELSPEDREAAKAELDLTDAELDRVLAGEPVVNGGVIICKECQDRLCEEQYGV